MKQRHHYEDDHPKMMSAYNRVVHVGHSRPWRCREQENGTHERHPQNSNDRHRQAKPAQVEGPRGEIILSQEPRRDRNAVRYGGEMERDVSRSTTITGSLHITSHLPT